MSQSPSMDKLLTFDEIKRLSELIFIPAGFVSQVKDTNNNILWEDRKTQEILGDRTGHKCYKVNFGRESPCSLCTASLSIDSMKTVTKEDRNVITGNWYSVIAIPIIFEGNLAAIELIQDITSNKLKGQQLDSIHTTKPIVTNIISHDIPNYLNIVNSALESLQVTTYNQKDINEFLSIAQQNTEKVLDILQDLKSISLLEESIENLYAVNIHQILYQTVTNVRTLFTGRNITINVNETTELNNIWIMANNLVSEIFLNILTNSIKHIADDGEIRIDIDIYEVIEVAEYIEVKITDYGSGIPPEIKSVLFDRKKRIEHGWRPSKGSTGLGMTIIKSLCDAFGAEIRYTNRIEDDWTKGTVVILRFPQLKKN